MKYYHEAEQTYGGRESYNSSLNKKIRSKKRIFSSYLYL